jgi:hypothetical protein
MMAEHDRAAAARQAVLTHAASGQQPETSSRRGRAARNSISLFSLFARKQQSCYCFLVYILV